MFVLTGAQKKGTFTTSLGCEGTLIVLFFKLYQSSFVVTGENAAIRPTDTDFFF